MFLFFVQKKSFCSVTVATALIGVMSFFQGCQSAPPRTCRWLTPTATSPEQTSPKIVRGQGGVPLPSYSEPLESVVPYGGYAPQSGNTFSSQEVSPVPAIPVLPYHAMPESPIIQNSAAPNAMPMTPPMAQEPLSLPSPDAYPTHLPLALPNMPENQSLPLLPPPIPMDAGIHDQLLPPLPPYPALPGLPNDPLSSRNSVSLEEAARQEAAMQERIRDNELAKKKQQDGTPSYLAPLPDPLGPFASRQSKITTEQDLVRQVSHNGELPPEAYKNQPLYDWEKEKQEFDWSVLDPVNFFTKVRDLMGMGPDEKKANAAMKAGREILLDNPDLKNKTKSLAAAKEFKTAAWRWPDSVIEEDALHLAAECYFFGEDYYHAMLAYQQLLQKYQHSKYLNNAVKRLFAIAKYWEAEDRRGVSFFNYGYMTDKTRPFSDTFGFCKKTYESIYMHDPNGPFSDDAVMALGSAYLAKGCYDGDTNFDYAAEQFKFLRENYPLSKHIAKAHEYELVARNRAYQGPETIGNHLTETGKLADITLQQFGGELDDKKEIADMKETIIQREAERTWTYAQYYDKKKYYGSARVYYEQILDRYPQTNFAEKAKERLVQIKDYRDKPSNYELIEKLFKSRG